MKREQAEQIARSVLTAVNADTAWPSVNHVANAIMEAVAVEKEDWAKTAETWPHPASWLAVAMRAGLSAEQARARGER